MSGAQFRSGGLQSEAIGGCSLLDVYCGGLGVMVQEKVLNLLPAASTVSLFIPYYR